MYDKHIRQCLIAKLSHSDPEAAIFEELPLSRGVAKADCVSVNGHISGFEIKSDSDTLRRLPDQVEQYDQAFEYSTVVTAQKHLAKAASIIPEHWGVSLAYEHKGVIAIKTIRRARKNPALDLSVVLRLLWRNEVIRVARAHDVPIADSRMLVADLWSSILDKVNSKHLLESVRLSLKARSRSQSAAQ